jgi:DNA-binding beta-propeller fold protein YncE
MSPVLSTQAHQPNAPARGSFAFRTGLALLAAAVVTVAPSQAQSLELVQTIELKGKPGKLDHLIVDSKSQRLFLANKVNNTVEVVDLKAGKPLRQLRGQAGAQGLAYASDLDRLFIALGTGGYCNIFDGKDYKLLKTIKYADDADNVRYSPRTHLVYVAHAEKALGVIDGEALEQKADVNLPGSAESFQIESERPRLYLNIPSPSQVVVIDTDKNEVIQSYPLKLASANFAMALDQPNHRLFIGCRKKPSVVIMDTEAGNEITSVDIPADTDDVFYDAKRKRIYASCGEGFIAVIKQVDPDHYELQEKIPSVKDARTSYLDAETGRYYLAVPRQPGKAGPEIHVYEPR